MTWVRRLPGWQAVLVTLLLIALMGGGEPARAEADGGSTPWSAPVAVASSLSQAAQPALAYTSDGVLHAVWVSEGRMYYAFQPPRGPWSAGKRLVNGSSPTLAVDSRNTLHLLFANRIFDNYEIYHATLLPSGWTPPVNVSHTRGRSAAPYLFAGKDALLQAVWMDNSPGYWCIYVATYNGAYWTNRPVPYGRGESPKGAVGPDGTIFVAWQARVPRAGDPVGLFDVFLSEGRGSAWDMPSDISDQPSADSIGVSMAVANNRAQLVWVERNKEVRYAFGSGSYWASANTVFRADTLVRGPSIAVERDLLLHVAWDEGQRIRVSTSLAASIAWGTPEVVAQSPADMKDVTLTSNPRGGIVVGWIQATAPGELGFYTSSHSTGLRARVWLPIVQKR